MIYYVKYNIVSSKYVLVEADTPQEALDKSEDLVYESDLNMVEDIEYTPVKVEDEMGHTKMEVDYGRI